MSVFIKQNNLPSLGPGSQQNYPQREPFSPFVGYQYSIYVV